MLTSAADLAAPEAAPLDLHEGIVDPRADGCLRWPENLWLLRESTGELVRGRCRATNLCRYCQTLYVVETVEMLTLDAAEYAPTLWVVLTAREHLTRAECRRHLEQLRKVARAIWPEVEWFVQVEFQRRGALHLNLLVKGVPVAEVERLRLVLVERWCARVDAEPVGQWAGAIGEAEGVVRYLSKMLAHGLKAEQAPPIGWRGHRTSQTRGYLVRPASQMRQEARAALRLKRKLWRGLSLEVAQHELAQEAQEVWRLVDHLPVQVRGRRERPADPGSPSPPSAWVGQSTGTGSEARQGGWPASAGRPPAPGVAIDGPPSRGSRGMHPPRAAAVDVDVGNPPAAGVSAGTMCTAGVAPHQPL